MSLPIFLLAPLLFVGGVVSTISGGGLGILMLVLGSFFLDIRTNITLNSVLMLGMQVSKIVNFHRNIRWEYVWWYAFLGVPCSFLGGLVLFHVPMHVPEIGLAIVCTGFVILRLIHPKLRLSSRRSCLIGYGALNGFLGGLIGNAALIRGPILLSLGLTKGAFIGTSSMTAFLMNLGKISAYLTKMVWSSEMLIFLCMGFPFLFAGVWIGKHILHYVSPWLFEKMLLGVIVIGALRLLFSAL
ncbi:MAG: sulfite exporter TauE/SafE family protein [Candidatus Peribacteraceae bacterium]|jgi:hypothetical protein